MGGCISAESAKPAGRSGDKQRALDPATPEPVAPAAGSPSSTTAAPRTPNGRFLASTPTLPRIESGNELLCEPGEENKICMIK